MILKDRRKQPPLNEAARNMSSNFYKANILPRLACRYCSMLSTVEFRIVERVLPTTCMVLLLLYYKSMCSRRHGIGRGIVLILSLFSNELVLIRDPKTFVPGLQVDNNAPDPQGYSYYITHTFTREAQQVRVMNEIQALTSINSTLTVVCYKLQFYYVQVKLCCIQVYHNAYHMRQKRPNRGHTSREGALVMQLQVQNLLRIYYKYNYNMIQSVYFNNCYCSWLLYNTA